MNIKTAVSLLNLKTSLKILLSEHDQLLIVKLIKLYQADTLHLEQKAR